LIALGAIARSGNLSELSRRTGMSREGLYKALSADGNPSCATIVKVARALGLTISFHTIA
jgi:probable addiction module antidote protein